MSWEKFGGRNGLRFKWGYMETVSAFDEMMM
jgi:hypothetical protein